MRKYELNAEARKLFGKGAIRRLRRSGKVPGVLYGAGKDPVALQLEENELVQQLDREAFYSHILSLKMNGNSERVVLKDLQRHPYKRQVLHIDLQRIDEKQKLTMRVPVHLINEHKCVGVKQQGGVISRLMAELEVVCLPKDLPEFIEVDIAEVHVGQTIHVGDLKSPKGVELAALAHGGDPAQPVVSVHLPRVVTEVAGEEEVVGEAIAETETAPGSESS